MKNFKQLVKSLPTKSVVFTYGKFNPLTNESIYVLKAAKKLAESTNSKLVVYTNETTANSHNPLLSERKEHYFKMSFPDINLTFVKNINEALLNVSKHYKDITFVSSDKTLSEENQNFKKNNIKVINLGKHTLSEDVCIKAAKSGDYNTFKSNIPSTIRDIDAKLMMNEIRQGLNLDPIREQVKFDIDELREQYFRKQIFNVGQIVESKGEVFEILARGSNYLTVVDSSGNTSKKWIQECVVIQQKIEEDIQPGYAPKEISFKGYTTKNLHHSEDAAKAFQATIERYGKSDPVSVLNALKSTDTYMKLNDLHLEQGKAPDDNELETWKEAHAKARESLQRIGEFAHHEDYWHMHEHEIQNMEGNYNPATAGADMNESIDSRVTIDKNSNYNAAKDVMRYSDFKKLLKINKGEVEEQNGQETAVDQTDAVAQDEVSVVEPKRTIGHSLTKDNDDDHLRRMKVKYHLGEETVDEDVYTSDYKISASGRKYHPHRINFKNSKANSEPLKNDDDSVKEDETIKLKKTHNVKADAIGGGAQNKGFDAFFLEDTSELENEKDDDGVTDDELDKMVDDINDVEDVIDAYDDNELCVVDDEGEEVEKLEEEVINEVLSRMERIRAKVRFARTKAKRERKVQIALKRHSDTKTINRRARKLAINLIKKRLARKNLSKLSTGEKERLETFIQKRKNLVNRLAMKLTPKIRKIEQTRLSHHKYTKE